MKIFWLAMATLFVVIWFYQLILQSGYQVTDTVGTSSKNIERFKNLFMRKASYIPEKVSKKEILQIAGIALGIRLVVYIVAAAFLYINSGNAEFTFEQFVSAWNRWDSPHYIEIAQNGYSYTEDGKHLFLVFFPLYPWLVRIANVVVNNWELSCLLVSNLAYIAGICFFYATISEEYGKSIAHRAIMLLSFYPFGFFHGGMMTESLFLLTMSMGLFFIKRHKWLAVGLVGILCTLCRVQGIILLGVAGVEFLVYYKPIQMLCNKQGKVLLKTIFTKGIFIFLMPIGNLIYFYINYAISGNPFQFSVYQQEHWHHSTALFTTVLQEIVDYIQSPNVSNTNLMCIWIPELLLFILAFICLFYGIGRHPLKYTAYLFVYTIANYSLTFMYSGGRYMASAFPLFIIGAEFFEDHPKLYQVVLITSSMLMAMYMAGYFMGKQIM